MVRAERLKSTGSWFAHVKVGESSKYGVVPAKAGTHDHRPIN
jgi:hypothetical protein